MSLETFLGRKIAEYDPPVRGDAITGARYYSKDWAQQEWDRVWTRVWHIGGMAADLVQTGDYITHNLVRESVVMMKQQDGSVRAFFNACKHRGYRLAWNEVGGGDVEDVGEMVGDAEPGQHVLGVAQRAVGEHQLAPGQSGERGIQLGSGRNHRQIQLVDIVEIVVRIDFRMVQQEPAQRRTILMEIAFLHLARGHAVELEVLGEKRPHQDIDLIEQPAFARIERVIEVEHPIAHPRQIVRLIINHLILHDF